MCILNSVGANGINNQVDVKTVQILLNMNLGKLVPLRPLIEDGQIGNQALNAIYEFQHRIVKMPNPDRKVDPKGNTLRLLQENISSEFTEDKLKAIMIHASRNNIVKYFNALKKTMTLNRIDTPLRMAHFLAQIGHESGDLKYSEEIASGSNYEGRIDLGNTEQGDGIRFKGRGLIQLTGRANYEAYGKDRNKDYVSGNNNLLIASDPYLAVDVACWFWTKHHLNEIEDTDNIVKITKAINGGENGIEDRKKRLVRAKFFRKIR